MLPNLRPIARAPSDELERLMLMQLMDNPGGTGGPGSGVRLTPAELGDTPIPDEMAERLRQHIAGLTPNDPASSVNVPPPELFQRDPMITDPALARLYRAIVKRVPELGVNRTARIQMSPTHGTAAFMADLGQPGITDYIPSGLYGLNEGAPNKLGSVIAINPRQPPPQSLTGTLLHELVHNVTRGNVGGDDEQFVRRAVSGALPDITLRREEPLSPLISRNPDGAYVIRIPKTKR